MKNPLALPLFAPRFLAAVFGLVVVASFAPHLNAQDAATRELDHLEDVWGNAEVAKDGDTLGTLLADDFVSIGPDGEVMDKPHYLADIKANTEDYISTSDTDRKIRVYGNAAVDTGLWTQTVKTEKGPQKERFRWTSVWIRQPDQHWLCVSTHVAHLPPAGN